MTKKLLIVGQGRAGKDTAGDYLAGVTNLKFAGTTSKYLCKYVAKVLGVSEEEAYADRHNNRMFWFDLGNKIREKDPLKLINEAFADGDITGGIRDKAEIDAVQKRGDILIVWIENNRVPIDPTVKFGKEDCDIIIENNGSIHEFCEKLHKFAKFAGLMDYL